MSARPGRYLLQRWQYDPTTRTYIERGAPEPYSNLAIAQAAVRRYAAEDGAHPDLFDTARSVWVGSDE